MISSSVLLALPEGELGLLVATTNALTLSFFLCFLKKSLVWAGSFLLTPFEPANSEAFVTFVTSSSLTYFLSALHVTRFSLAPGFSLPELSSSTLSVAEFCCLV